MASITLVSETNEQCVADVIFIHGLRGNAIDTWEYTDPKYEEKSFWLKELADDLPTAAVWSVGYDSSPTKWLGRNMPMLDRANSLLDVLDANRIGSRPVIFVAHSLGGLLAKAILRVSCDTPAEHDKHRLHKNTRGFIFFSTPHTGSSIANLASCILGGRPTEVIKELAENDAYLRDLSQWFSDKGKELAIHCATYFEAHKTMKVTVVDPTSANPNLGMRPVPFDGDHFSICKIRDSSDSRYKQVFKFIKKIVDECTAPAVKTAELAAVDGVDFEIGVLPNPPQDGRVVEFHPPSRILTYIARAGRDSLSIVPRMGYLDDVAKGRVIDPSAYFWNPFKCQFPSLDVMLVNNSGKTLVLSEAVIEVASSRPDFSPVVVIPSNTWDMKLVIKNEGWGKISSASLRCNLLPTNPVGYMPDPPIDDIEVRDPFTHEFVLGDFAESVEVDLRDAIGDLGVNLVAIANAPKRSQQMYAFRAMQAGEDVALAKHMGRFPEMEDDSAWAPFPNGYVVVVGRLDFDSMNAEGMETHFSLPIRARVFMFHMRYDLPMPPSYQYSAELEHTGTNYEVRVKLSQTLKAGEADRFTIRLSCTQSAFHELRIRWNFVGGSSSTSQGFRLQHFVPRTFAGEESEKVADGKLDPERDNVPTVITGDCIEHSLGMAMMTAHAVAQANSAQTTSDKQRLDPEGE